MTARSCADHARDRRATLPRCAAAAVVLATAVTLAAVATPGPVARAAPADSTALTFEVTGSAGGLHLSIAPEGGVMVPAGVSSVETALPRTVVRDDRGGGARSWSATVGTTGIGQDVTVSYRAASLRVPETGTVLNRMPTWVTVGAAQEAVAASGITRPSVVSSWEPHVRVSSGQAGGGSVGNGSLGGGSLGAWSLGAGSSGSSGAGSSGSTGAGSSGSTSAGSSGSSGSSDPGDQSLRGALITSVM